MEKWPVGVINNKIIINHNNIEISNNKINFKNNTINGINFASCQTDHGDINTKDFAKKTKFPLHVFTMPPIPYIKEKLGYHLTFDIFNNDMIASNTEYKYVNFYKINSKLQQDISERYEMINENTDDENTDDENTYDENTDNNNTDNNNTDNNNTDDENTTKFKIDDLDFLSEITSPKSIKLRIKMMLELVWNQLRV